MSWARGNSQQRLPYQHHVVFAALLRALPRAGLKVKSSNPALGRIQASAGISSFSWGENVTVVCEDAGVDATVVYLESSQKVGTNFLGGGRHQRNFDAVLSALMTELEGLRGTKTCGQCGSHLEPAAKFCRSCGSSVEEQEASTACPNCGAPRADTANFCEKCGTRLRE